MAGPAAFSDIMPLPLSSGFESVDKASTEDIEAEIENEVAEEIAEVDEIIFEPQEVEKEDEQKIPKKI